MPAGAGGNRAGGTRAGRIATGGIGVGVIGGGPPATVDAAGTLRPAGAGWTLEWWIGADDRWHLPVHEVAVRQHRVADAPVVETAMRVPGGDAIHRVYGAAAPGQPIVIDVENRSPAPFVVALVVRGAARVTAEGRAAVVDRAFALSWARAPSRWARTVGTPVQVPVVTGHAEAGPFPPANDRAARLEVAFLHPVAHRTVWRAALTRSRVAPDVDVRALPAPDAVAAGWRHVLDRGMQVQLPDPSLDARLRAARAEVLLRAQGPRPDPTVVAALEDWGFDDEAAEAWSRLGVRAKRRAAVRPEPTSWAALGAVADDAELLVAARRLLVDDRPDRAAPVVLCADHPEHWRGQPLEVRDAPVAGGRLSYAIRWHGARPALLWDAPAGTRVCVPALDPDWESPAPSGEALLGALRRSGA